MNRSVFRKWSLFLLAICFSLTVEAGGLLGDVSVDQLPVEVKETIALIKHGGPFPYKKDRYIFNNYEKHLPNKRRGYYREYTVKTPGVRSRGARRIVSGGSPTMKAEFYYTADHYKTFRRVRE